MKTLRFLLCTVALWLAPTVLAVEPEPKDENAPSVVFIGNSFTFGFGSPVQFYRAQSVTDLNHEGKGGVPALFKMFTNEAGRSFRVCLETVGGTNLDYHVQTKAAVIGQPWDYVVTQGYSLLDKNNPGDPTMLVSSAKELADLLRSKNPNVDRGARPITQATLRIGKTGELQSVTTTPDQKTVTYDLTLPTGKTTLDAQCLGADGKFLTSAFYVKATYLQ
jgi:hypothetical protein